MKLPYTPHPGGDRHAEEERRRRLRAWTALPVVCLHAAQPARARLRRHRPRIGGSPTSSSRAARCPCRCPTRVRALRRDRAPRVPIAVGPCLDGDVACVSVAVGAGVGRRGGVRRGVCAIGPGIVGTGYRSRARRALRRGGAGRCPGARRSPDPRAARLGRRPPGAPPWPVASHARPCSRLLPGRRRCGLAGRARTPASRSPVCSRSTSSRLAGRVRGAAALDDGPRPGGGALVLRRRLRRREARRRRARGVATLAPDEGRRRHRDQGGRAPRRADARRARASSSSAATRCSSRPAPGVGSAFPDAAYEAAGARVCDRRRRLGAAELLLKVKEPLPEEYGRLRDGLVLFTYLHLAADETLTPALVDAGATCIAYETVQTDGREAAAARADERGRRPARDADGRLGAREGRRAAAGSCSAASRASRRPGCSSSAAASSATTRR